MKTKLISMYWRGSASVDPRFSAAMLSWCIADIRTRDVYNRLSVGVENGLVESYNSDFELQFTHHVKHIVGMCKITKKRGNETRTRFLSGTTKQSNAVDQTYMEIIGEANGLVYLIKEPRDPLLHIHLYEGNSMDEMTELMQQIRDPTHGFGGSVGSIPQSFIPAGGSNSDTSLHSTLATNGLHSTPATNLKLSHAVKNAEHDGSPSLISNPTNRRLHGSKSYTSGLNSSAAKMNLPCSNSMSSGISTINEITPNNSQFFEVMYVGKIRVSHKRVPYTFIDDALPKFKAYDAKRIRMAAEQSTSNLSECDSEENTTNTSRKNSIDEVEEDAELVETKTPTKEDGNTVSEELAKPDNEDRSEEFKEKILSTKFTEDNKENTPRSKILLRGQSHAGLPNRKETPKQRDRSASIGAIPQVEQNRTMVFLIGKSDMRLISPDRKQVLLYKDFRDVASCAQGHKNADHFGIICRETNQDGYIGYVFKCQSEQVADDIVAAISQAFATCSELRKSEQKNRAQFSCEHCPMLWYHHLCSDCEGLNDKKTQQLIFKRIEQLPEDEQTIIIQKYFGAEEMSGHTIGEQNQFLMMLLRAHCESRQQRHVHDTAENRSEFLNQYLGGSTIFMKAKRSLTNSFDHLLKRKGTKDECSTSQQKDASPKELPDDTEPMMRPRSCTIGSTPPSNKSASVEQLKSPMMDIFIKVGNSPKQNQDIQGSWRQAMLHRVVTPSKNLNEMDDAAYLTPLRSQKKKPQHKRTRTELIELWKTAIHQTILLNRMEKENARLQARQNENEIKKIKLDYDEIVACDRQAVERWETFLDNETQINNKRDPKVVLHSIKTGVPKIKRGDVWLFVAAQNEMNTAPIDDKKFPNFNTPYHVLLKSLTQHQHAIFIDLGRTFPHHRFYKQALGLGQLSLFNLLKAYSILDPELGYCQGLGFICAVLLLHCEEEDAFSLLKHLMFKRQMRTKYLPDMKQFQLQLYQLSRLLKDYLPDLYEWLNENDVSPTLYAAPWILTVFSSQFPLGFVARVFDYMFYESSDVIFKVSLALLETHKDELMQRDNFEDIMNFMKNSVPKMDSEKMENIMKTALKYDVFRQLAEYQVEYTVLQEEISTSNQHLEALKREKQTNQNLVNQLQLAQSSITQLEKIKKSQDGQIQNLNIQIQTMENTVQVLGQFLNNLVDKRPDIELPGDIRRIIQSMDNIATARRMPIFVERKIGKSMSVNSHLGFPLKALEELNETLDRDSTQSPMKKKSQFFESTYEQIRQQKNGMRLKKLDGNETNNNDKGVSPSTDNDSGVDTPLTPSTNAIVISNPENLNDTIKMPPPAAPIQTPENLYHPLGNLDVNIKFNGTTQLKSLTKSLNRPSVNEKSNASDNLESKLIM